VPGLLLPLPSFAMPPLRIQFPLTLLGAGMGCCQKIGDCAPIN
jgi:hypothetical protein